jgi:flavin-dependent dehydrogenase
MSADLVIVGAGPAGLTAAIHAAQRGLSSVVIDRRRPAPDDGCGEALMPSSVDLLDRLGVELPLRGPQALAGIRFCDADGRADGLFHAGHGLGLQWSMLGSALHERATMLGVTLRYGETATAWRDLGDSVVVDTSSGRVTGRFLVGADGSRGAIGRQAGLTVASRDERCAHACRRYAIAPGSRYVEVHCADEGEIFVVPTGTGAVDLMVRARRSADCARVLASSSNLARRIAGAGASDPVLHDRTLARRTWRRHRGNVALVGDAARTFDPLGGESVTLAMRTAMALTEVIAQERSLRHYERSYRRLTRNRVLFDRLLTAAASRPETRRRLIAGLRAAPEAFGRLLEVAGGTRKLTSVGALPVVRLAAGIARTPPWRAPVPQASVVQLEDHAYRLVDVPRIEVADRARVRGEPSLDAGGR